jgi:hypothetical protein
MTLFLRRFFVLLSVVSVWVLPQPNQAETIEGDVRGATQFSHPPLRYRGPDPLAEQFLPISVMGGPEGLTPPNIPPSQFLAPQTTVFGETLDSFLPPHQADPYGPLLHDPHAFGPLITDHKDGFFQKIKLTGTWLDRNDKIDNFGITEIDLLATFAAPLPSRDSPLLITPTAKARYLDGPGPVDLPGAVYETYLEFLWLPRIGERWTAILGIAPGVYSDFEIDHSDAFRWTGTGLVRFNWTPGTTQVIFGVLYLNRNDIRLLPAGGVIWTPNADRRYEFLFPKPRFAHRIAFGPAFEDWLYLGGEFGGNSYSIQRLSGAADTITLRDIRTYLGLQRKLNGGAGYHIEIGVVVGRVIEFQSATPDVEADPTVMVRGGVTF